MTPKCSVLLKVRQRPNLLRRCLDSIFEHSKREDIEVLIRHDDDDETLEPVFSIWKNDPNVRFFAGPAFGGYDSISRLYGELNDHALAPWCLYLNDDMTIRDDTGTASWPERLMTIDPRAIVQAEWHFIGPSSYQNVKNTGAPIAPKHCWRQFGSAELPHPFDSWFYYKWLEEGLPLENLPGFSTIHNWKASDAAAAYK